MFCIDMTDLPIDECKRRNACRIPLKRVPEEVIDKMYSRFRTQKIPSGIKVIKTENDFNSMLMHKLDMSSYEKIVVVGDLHGCHTALMEYFNGGLNDNYFYIFVGDYIDRGIENAEVIKFLLSIYEKKNVLLLEGNHERWIKAYSNDEVSKSKEFEFVTKKQLDASDISKKDLRQLCRKLGQVAWFTYGDKEIVVTHGGIATMPENLSFMATTQMIHGVGDYNDSDIIADTWLITTADNMYQVHGHRNVKNVPMKVNDRVYNLEGKVEFGGFLRILELDKDGFHEVEIKNTVFKSPEAIAQSVSLSDSSIADIVLKMRQNKFIQEKSYGNISSFNFTREAFYDKVWDDQTVKARGLYIDTNRMKVSCRGFVKFFNINERPECRFEMLQHTLQFPVTCYVKENGFLGLVSYNPDTDDLFITTKSSPEGSYAEWLKDMVYRKVQNIDLMKQICKEQDVTFVFECVDMENDPHIIKYQDDELFLLAIVKNSMDFIQYEYDDLVNTANEIGVKCKTKAVELGTWAEFVDWYNEVLDPDYEFNGRIIEGFVIEDSAGYMTKVKLTYYNFWKFMRGLTHEVLQRGHFHKTSALTTPTANDYYGFIKNVFDTTDKETRQSMPRDIIYWRDEFYDSTDT